jgi:hypothetical protein
MSDNRHWLEKLMQDDPEFKDYGFKRLPDGFLDKLGEAVADGDLTDEEITDSLRAGEIKRDADLPIN